MISAPRTNRYGCQKFNLIAVCGDTQSDTSRQQIVIIYSTFISLGMRLLSICLLWFDLIRNIDHLCMFFIYSSVPEEISCENEELQKHQMNSDKENFIQSIRPEYTANASSMSHSATWIRIESTKNKLPNRQPSTDREKVSLNQFVPPCKTHSDISHRNQHQSIP